MNCEFHEVSNLVWFTHTSQVPSMVFVIELFNKYLFIELISAIVPYSVCIQNSILVTLNSLDEMMHTHNYNCVLSSLYYGSKGEQTISSKWRNNGKLC